MMKTSDAPARSAESWTARFSTCVIPDGTEMTIRGRTKSERPCAFLMKWSSIFSVTSKSAMTPSFIGRIATMLPGVRPEHVLGLGADRLDAVRDGVDGDDRRLAHDDSLAAGEDERVRGAEVDGEIVGEDGEEGFECQTNLRTVLSLSCQSQFSGVPTED